MKQTPNRGVRPRTDRSSPTSAAPKAKGAFGALIPELQRAVTAAGYTTPTPIQEQCIPHLLQGRDLMGSAQTGTGKTAAFALPLLQLLAPNKRRPARGAPRALILTPTRELAAQVEESIKTYGRFLRLSQTVIYGGVKQGSQVQALNRGVDIVVATPGRLLDLMTQGHIRLSDVGIFVLDEVDRMLDMGFIPDIKRLLAEIPDKRQNLFFSATMPPAVAKLAETMLHNPVRVALSHEEPTVECIKQNVVFVGKHDKNSLLVELLREPETSKALVFTQMKHVANRLLGKLNDAGIHGAAIHGNKSQAARNRALEGFKRGKYQVLVATDVAARGLDVDDISHVINYDLPTEAETYVHRIGRTARAGAEGNAISLCTAEDRAYLRDIEHLLGKPVPPDLDNPYHCEEALHSTLPKKGYGGKQSQRSRGRRSRAGSRR
ncbi:MAG: DEAD/DEAH box helicase [Candidatus Pacebacteria bacterium]|nr:DEAD/DEAH box helicase [Candidatus Paceibacterota bacterium]